MGTRKVLASGLLEGSVGLLFMLLSLLSFAAGRTPPAAVLLDLTALCTLAVTVRSSRIGWPLVCLVSAIGLVADPSGLGLSPYVSACAVTLLIRRAELRPAGLVTGTVMACSTGRVLLRPSMESTGADVGVLSTSLTAAFSLLLAWVIGLGFRWVARREAARVSQEYVDRQTRMAVDIHDFVGRNLTGMLVRADGAVMDQRSKAEFFDELVHGIRQADTSLREVTAELQRDGLPALARAPGAAESLRQGLAELTAVGIDVEEGPSTGKGLSGLPPEVDLVIGRIIAEALHNVAKHGDRSRPCSVVADKQGPTLKIVVTNGMDGGYTQGRRSLGLVGIRRQAASVGGTAEAGPEGNLWRCRVTIPVPPSQGN